MTIPNPVNETQRRFNELCERGGGQRGGPARTRVQQLLAQSGRALTARGHQEITEHLRNCANSNPWHVCFAVGLCWGRLARLDLEFTGAAVRLIEHWNDADLRQARRFHYERADQRGTNSMTRRSSRVQSTRTTDYSKNFIAATRPGICSMSTAGFTCWALGSPILIIGSDAFF